ncbi:MAG: dehydrogenase E1 component subunit alpha/beta [Bacteroidetes bacterium]|nr:dehydrogenase E1 component subunit alpha/beta [Bacteroidota bacterium]
MNYSRYQYPDEILKELFKALLKPRMIEEKMLVLLRQGRIGKWFSGIGQEAISVGVTSALSATDFILPLHRNLGVFTTRQVPFEKLFAQWQGKPSGFTKGRDRSFHFGAPEHHIIGMISHLGAMHGVADGIALGNQLDQSDQITCVFSGEGGTSEGDFHEALNLAAVWDLPVLFIVENNGYGLSTPTSDQFRCASIADKGKGYGIRSKSIDGNNILEVFSEVDRIARRMRKNPAPFLLECRTFRMRGHEEASGVKYVPEKLLEAWSKKDPIAQYQRFLLQEGILIQAEIDALEQQFKWEIEQGIRTVDGEPDVVDTSSELSEVYAVSNHSTLASSDSSQHLRLVDAVSDGLRESMRMHPNLVLMGQDIADYGGVFKVTEGFVNEFGASRVRNTPICESAVVGAALGLSLTGKKAMVEMQFADFVTCGFNQIVNNLAKTHYRWNHAVDVTIRMPTGAGVSAGPFHSQSNEAWFVHVPGLKVVYPSNPYDAKGLLMASINECNPVLFFEHKKLYRSIEGAVPDGPYTIELGKAASVRSGEEVSIITYGWGVHWATEQVDELGLDADIIDLRTLLPWDQDAVRESVQKTGKVIILHEDTMTGGIGAEISAWISEHCFESLDAPVMRCASLDTPIPMASKLESNFLANSRFQEQLLKLVNY